MSAVAVNSWVEIDLDIIRENYLLYSRKLRPGQEIMAVLKADAYGHGAVKVGSVLSALGCRNFAVANIREALELRQNGIAGRIVILSYTPAENAALLGKYDLTQTIVSESYAEQLAAAGCRAKCQFAVDTGMNRIGLDSSDPLHCAGIIRRFADVLNVDGIFTHLCHADTDAAEGAEFTALQIRRFEAVAALVRDLNLPYVHCLNSAGGVRCNNTKSDFVRLGIALYGLKPDRSFPMPSGIRPAMTWKTHISMIKEIRAGESIGYGRSFVAPAPMRIATLTVGYADGFSRSLSNRGFVIIRGRKAPVVGRVCMDQILVDVTGIPDAEPYEDAILLGVSGGVSCSADDMADIAGTIGYEVVCALSKRVERVYL